MISHAILYQLTSGEYSLYKGDTSCPVTIPPHLEQILSVFEQHSIDVLWIMPNCGLSKHIQWSDFEALDRDRVKVFPTKPGKDAKRPTFVSIRRQSGHKFERDRYLAFPAHQEWMPTGDKHWFLPSPYVLAQTLRYLAQEFEMEPMWGPGNMGMKGLERIYAKKGWHIENTVLTPKLRSVLNQAMVRPIWKRFYGLTDEQKGMLYLIGFDKNGQFLGGAQSVLLGDGQPQEVDGAAFNLKSIGFWRYKIKDVRHSAFNGYDLYCPLDVNRQWASTDLIQAARTVNVELDLFEGLVWSSGKKYLEDWAKESWGHRVNLRDAEKYPSEVARENAAGTSKLAPNMLMGRLATPTNNLYRPDWNLGIVHKSIGNQVYSYRKILNDHGIKPVLVTTDSFWIVTNEPDPAKAIPGILDYQLEQRGYKHVGTVPMDKTIIDLFSTARPEAISAYLKQKTEGE